jgi:hypothetical protein
MQQKIVCAMAIKTEQWILDYRDDEIDKNIETKEKGELATIYTFDQLQGAQERISMILSICDQIDEWKNINENSRAAEPFVGYMKEKAQFESLFKKIDHIINLKLQKLLKASLRWK